jgi:DNA-binding NtrC family response regulator
MIFQPRVLVVDDVIGSESGDALTQENRRIYCAALGLQDEALAPGLLDHAPVASAMFTSGQRKAGANLENSLAVVEATFRAGWPTPDGRYWSAVIADMKFGNDERFGLQVIDLIHRIAPEVPIIVVSSLDQLNVRAGESLRDAAQRVGAQEFLSAPALDRNVEPAYRSTPSNFEERLDVLGLLPDPEQRVVGTSLAICLTLREIRTRIPRDGVNQILLLGGSGLGKSHFEGYIHREVAGRSGRRVERTVAKRVPLAGVAEEMQKKALFGTAGATGVLAGPGAFEEARDGGVVFLDEIGELGPGGQSDLLGPLQPIKSTDGHYYRPFSRMGSSKEERSRCFVWAATNKDLDLLVRDGRFSEALLHRFDGNRVVVPSLKERKTDLTLLIDHFLNEACDQFGIRTRPRLDVPSSAWEDYAEGHSIRELRNHIAAVVSKNQYKTLLTEADFFRNPVAQSSPGALRASGPEPAGTVSELIGILEAWNPAPHMTIDEFEGAFEKLDLAFATSKLRLWRELLARQKAISGDAINLLGTVKQLLGKKKIAKSKPSDVALKIFQAAQVKERPTDPILAQIWDRRRGARIGQK